MKETVPEKATITIHLERTGPAQYNSDFKLDNVDALAAAWILIDIGREILVSALNHQPSEKGDSKNGH